ncbi:MAG: UDP-glucose 4-epimerase GalE [Pseudomonadales bacterium]|nr:UDP-glucose 4-epimerase GalE [Pseudomonadales bacterium]
MGEILVTGGAGYIGSHMCVALLDAGYTVTVLDNLSNSTSESIAAVQRVTNRTLDFVADDLRDAGALARLFGRKRFAAVLHFAGLKAVGQSTADPLAYYDNNVVGTLRLLEAMTAHQVRTLVFSSSATVYGIPDVMPITEDSPPGPINPYGRTKFHIEQILADLQATDPAWRISILRYFNPVGAHISGDLGEDPNDVPNNLMPYIAQVAVGRLPGLRIFGDDYPTPDGTGVRDYIHVDDLVEGHLAALRYLERHPGLAIHNLGTGRGHSVLEMVRAFEAASGRTIPCEIVARRAGDAAESYADPTKANRELGWRARHDVRRMCEDVWRWQQRHPQGYRA